MKPWQVDKAWSDNFNPEIKSLLGRHLIQEADEDDDRHRATDLIMPCMARPADNYGMGAVMIIGAYRVAVRMRKMSDWNWYKDQFTLRSRRPNNVATEQSKILAGWGDFLFYGFGTEGSASVFAWAIGNLEVFREWIRDGGKPSIKEKENRDRSSFFQAYLWSELPSGFVVAHGGEMMVTPRLRIEMPTQPPSSPTQPPQLGLGF